MSEIRTADPNGGRLRSYPGGDQLRGTPGRPDGQPGADQADEQERAGDGRTNVELERTIGGAAGSLTRATFVELYVSGAWQALARIVRPGDVLRFYASEDNSNGYLRAAEIPAGKMDGYHTHGYDRIYIDELCVDVVRKRRSVVERLVLCHSVCPQNSARAVVPSGAKRYPSAEVA